MILDGLNKNSDQKIFREFINSGLKINNLKENEYQKQQNNQK